MTANLCLPWRRPAACLLQAVLRSPTSATRKCAVFQPTGRCRTRRISGVLAMQLSRNRLGTIRKRRWCGPGAGSSSSIWTNLLHSHRSPRSSGAVRFTCRERSSRCSESLERVRGCMPAEIAETQSASGGYFGDTGNYDAGYSSSSRLYERTASQLGMTPDKYRRGRNRSDHSVLR